MNMDTSDVRGLEKHTLQRFDDELNKLVTEMLQMGGLVEKQLQDALLSVEQMNIELAETVIENEDRVHVLSSEYAYPEMFENQCTFEPKIVHLAKDNSKYQL